MEKIFYKEGYKYQLVEEYEVKTTIIREPSDKSVIMSDYITLWASGLLLVERGYAWDGPSGPTVDTKTFMRGSLVHDALYQLMQLKLLDLRWRPFVDQELFRLCIEDGMTLIRAWYVWNAVKHFGEDHALPLGRKEILEAP